MRRDSWTATGEVLSADMSLMSLRWSGRNDISRAARFARPPRRFVIAQNGANTPELLGESGRVNHVTPATASTRKRPNKPGIIRGSRLVRN